MLFATPGSAADPPPDGTRLALDQPRSASLAAPLPSPLPNLPAPPLPSTVPLPHRHLTSVSSALQAAALAAAMGWLAWAAPAWGAETPAATVAATTTDATAAAALPEVIDTTATARAIELQFRAGESNQARQRLALALAARPTDASLRFLQGVLLSESDRPSDAVPVFERMTEDFPDLPEPYNNLAVLQAATGQLDRARALLETALRLDPAYHTAHENLGDVFVRLAQRAYEAAAAGPRAEPALKNKLRLARELASAR